MSSSYPFRVGYCGRVVRRPIARRRKRNPALRLLPLDAKDKDKASEKEAPLPADAHVAQSMQIEGKALHYTVTVGPCR